MTDQFGKLPLEIVFMILSYVPVYSLVSFGATSKSNHVYHALCMRKLHIAIFRKRVHAAVALLDARAQNSPKDLTLIGQPTGYEHYKIQVVLPQSTTCCCPCKFPKRNENCSSVPAKYKKRRSWVESFENRGCPSSVPIEQTIREQNKAFADIINRYGRALDDLEFLAYNLNEEGAIAIGRNCGLRLRQLALRFEHPYVRESLLTQKYWNTPAAGSTAWNSLIGIGPLKGGMNLTNLESLVLERAGITPWQLSMLIKRNKRLRVLKLRTCAAIQPGFLNWLGGISSLDGDVYDGQPVPGESLTVLWVENSNDIRTTNSTHSEGPRSDAGLEWLLNMKSLMSLSFRDCHNIDAHAVESANRIIWHIPELLLPQTRHSWLEHMSTIEVDPVNVL